VNTLRIVACGAFSLVAVSPAVAQESAARMSITVEKGRMTCSIDNSSLLEVLEDLGGKTAIAFVPAESIANDRLSLEVADVPVDDGIRQLLRDYDTFLYYAPGDDSVASLRVVWLYAKGAGSTLQPVPQESSSVAELREQVASPDARVREHAYIVLLARPDDQSRELVWSALRGATEIDEDLRQQILVSAMNRGTDVPQDLLANLVLGNDSATLRVLALDALAEDPTVESVATSVANDQSPMVRQRAQEILQAKAAANRLEHP